jgi:hypothetical protein
MSMKLAAEGASRKRRKPGPFRSPSGGAKGRADNSNDLSQPEFFHGAVL